MYRKHSPYLTDVSLTSSLEFNGTLSKRKKNIFFPSWRGEQSKIGIISWIPNDVCLKRGKQWQSNRLNSHIAVLLKYHYVSPNGHVQIQYIPRNVHTVFALLCFVVVIHRLIFPYPPDLLCWHCGNLAIAPVPAKQPWWIWINTSCEIIMNDYITTTKQSTTKPCAYLLGYTVNEDLWLVFCCIHMAYILWMLCSVRQIFLKHTTPVYLFAYGRFYHAATSFRFYNLSTHIRWVTMYTLYHESCMSEAWPL